jgi:hydroxymethylbilane synthase
MPLAAHAVMQGEALHLRAAWGDPEGAATLVTAELTEACAKLATAERMGTEVAARLRAGGAR